MTVRHLTGSAELITSLNRFGHGQSYTRTLDVETAMCNTITASKSVFLPTYQQKKKTWLSIFAGITLISMKKPHQEQVQLTRHMAL